ncbi:MAG: HlyD family efflux transporter periplasmic adaptor subunit [Pirellulales bacterium]|nr:HlyD family efflux transporter periplasmic adaptor subunit [Pirellulales bacterium]
MQTPHFWVGFGMWITVTLVMMPPVQGQDALEVSSVLLRIIESVDIPARCNGVLASVAVQEGTIVKEGDLLAQVDDRRALLLLKQAEAELEITRKKAKDDIDVRYARKSHEIAKAELDRAESANAKVAGIVSTREIDRLVLAVERTSLEIERSINNQEHARLENQKMESQLFVAKHELEDHRIDSPLDGMIVRVNKRRGEWVNPGDVVVHIVRIDRLRAEGFLNAKFATNDLIGRAVTILVELSVENQFQAEGSIVFVSPEADPVNSQVRFWAEIDNTKMQLRPGLRGTMRISPSIINSQR